MPDIAPTPNPDPWSILIGLGLSSAEVDSLQHQGFVAADYRRYQGARLGPYFKLRWRMDGQQRTKYLGQDAELAETVSVALAQLQRGKVLERQLARMVSEAKKSLKRAKKEMAAVMATKGKYYHGYTSRKRRTSRSKKSVDPFDSAD